MAGHAILAPSSAARWVHCHASALAEAMFPEDDSESSREGTAGHWVGEQFVRSMLGGGITPPARDSDAPNGFKVSDEMLDGAVMLLNDIFRTLNPLGLLRDVKIEHRVAMPQIHPTENWGTPDYWVWDPKARRIIVWDYKFGFRFVEVFENWQLMNYVAGILNALGIDGVDDQTVEVEIRVVQPRSFHPEGPVRSWKVLASSLRGYFNRLKSAAEHNLTGTAPATSGSHCRDCKAAHACNALLASTASILDYAASGLPAELPPRALGYELGLAEHAYDMLEVRLKALRADALARMQSGVDVPGFGITHPEGRLKWTKPAAEVFALGDLLDLDLRKPAEAITPTQAINKGVDESVINAYSGRSKGAATVTQFDATKTRKIFFQG